MEVMLNVCLVITLTCHSSNLPFDMKCINILIYILVRQYYILSHITGLADRIGEISKPRRHLYPSDEIGHNVY